jgi:hypothetical protein
LTSFIIDIKHQGNWLCGWYTRLTSFIIDMKQILTSNQKACS